MRAALRYGHLPSCHCHVRAGSPGRKGCCVDGRLHFLKRRETWHRFKVHGPARAGFTRHQAAPAGQPASTRIGDLGRQTCEEVLVQCRRDFVSHIKSRPSHIAVGRGRFTEIPADRNVRRVHAWLLVH